MLVLGFALEEAEEVVVVVDLMMSLELDVTTLQLKDLTSQWKLRPKTEQQMNSSELRMKKQNEAT